MGGRSLGRRNSNVQAAGPPKGLGSKTTCPGHRVLPGRAMEPRSIGPVRGAGVRGTSNRWLGRKRNAGPLIVLLLLQHRTRLPHRLLFKTTGGGLLHSPTLVGTRGKTACGGPWKTPIKNLQNPHFSFGPSDAPCGARRIIPLNEAPQKKTISHHFFFCHF